MKVRVADRFEQSGLAGPATAGCEVVDAPKSRGTDKVPNVVNHAPRSPAAHRLIVRHQDHPGVPAHVFRRLGAAQLSVQETENLVVDCAAAAVARINLERAPSRAICGRIVEGNDDSGSQAR